MAGHLTLAIIKPHVVFNRKVGNIISDIEEAGFGIIASKTIQLREEGARVFYQEHEGKDFFPYLVKTMSGGVIWVMVLAKKDCVEGWRNLIGATNPAEAAEGTLRNKYGDHVNMTMNAVHGSATDHDAMREINFFFAQELKVSRELEASEALENVGKEPGREVI
jgi:nucleoside-diphosphate kinase